jgi:hypothetical protein
MIRQRSHGNSGAPVRYNGGPKKQINARVALGNDYQHQEGFYIDR